MSAGTGHVPSEQVRVQEAARQSEWLRAARWLRSLDVLGLLVAYVVLFGCLVVFTSYFLTNQNLQNLLQEMAVLGIVAAGQTLVILRGEIDLSVSAVLPLSSVLAAEAVAHGYGTAVVILVALAAGAVFGLVNGLLVTMTSVSSLVITLGTLTAGEGLALVISGGAPQSVNSGFLGTLGQGSLGGIPYQFIVMVCVLLLVALTLRFTVFGRSVYAAGDNERAARLTGVAIGRVTVGVFVLSGLLAAVGALLLTGQLANADPTVGATENLQSIAAVVIGGASLFGGIGGIGGTFLGVALIATLANGLVQLNVPSAWQEVVTGAVIVIAVLADRLRARRRDR